MSVIRKTPYIETVIGSLTSEQLTTLKSVMNNPGTVSVDYSTMTSGIKGVVFKLDEQNTKTGILIYTTNHCLLIAYHRFQDVQLIKINTSTHTYEVVNEYCSIEELRRVITEGSGGSSDEWVEAMKEVMVYDDEDEEVQVGTDLSVDGELKVNEFSDIKDADGNSLPVGKMYNHTLTVVAGGGTYRISFVSKSSSQYTLDTLKTFIGAGSLTAIMSGSIYEVKLNPAGTEIWVMVLPDWVVVTSINYDYICEVK